MCIKDGTGPPTPKPSHNKPCHYYRLSQPTTPYSAPRTQTSTSLLTTSQQSIPSHQTKPPTPSYGVRQRNRSTQPAQPHSSHVQYLVHHSQGPESTTPIPNGTATPTPQKKTPPSSPVYASARSKIMHAAAQTRRWETTLPRGGTVCIRYEESG